jgi:hypothetical protein
VTGHNPVSTFLSWQEKLSSDVVVVRCLERVCQDVPFHCLAPVCEIKKLHTSFHSNVGIRGCIQKFPDWPPGARTANGTALCH